MNTWYERRRKRGVCAYCRDKATHGVTCERHSKEQRAKRKREIAERKRKGLCTRCGKLKPVAGGARCERCTNRQRDSNLKHRYGMTSAEVDALVASQGGCAICNRTAPGEQGWHVDHDHVTSKVRGVLCEGCNTGLGKMGESVERLQAAIDYLKRASARCATIPACPPLLSS